MVETPSDKFHILLDRRLAKFISYYQIQVSRASAILNWISQRISHTVCGMDL